MIQESYYQQPTCQLWLTGEVNPVTAWMGLGAWKSLSFTLVFEREPSGEKLELLGNREQLEHLHTAVNDYIQALLSHMGQHLAVAMTTPVRAYLQASSITDSQPTILLAPKSQLQHHLHLGALWPESQPQTLTLSVSQLFDLGNLLDECYQTMQPRPGLGQQTRKLWQKTPVWLQSTAVAAVILGVTTALMPLLQPAPLIVSQEATPEALPSELEPAPASPPANPNTPSFPRSALPPSGPLPPPIAPVPGSSPPAPITLKPSQTLPPPPAPIALPPSPSAAQNSSRQTTVIIPEGNNPSVARSGENPASGATANGLADTLPPAAPQAEMRSPAAVARSLTLESANNQALQNVKTFFSQNWRPPTELTQALEYTLILNPDGSLQRALPLNRAAEIFLDRTPIPLANDPFVAATQSSQPVQLRLVLEANGRVQVFNQN